MGCGTANFCQLKLISHQVQVFVQLFCKLIPLKIQAEYSIVTRI